jgi:glycerate kinase
MPSVLVAPDSFKGTFSAVAVAEAIGRGIRRAGMDVDPCPVADGGEGTMEVVLASLGGRVVEAPAHGPLGRELLAPFALLGEGGTQALVDTAAASGLALLSADELDPWRASTYGTGELIAAAIAAGAREVMIAVGGSATVDGGRGAVDAIAERGGTGTARLVVLCDVQTPWERCAEIYGPQKGADPEMVQRLSSRLDAYARELPRDPRQLPMTGGAGGLSGGLWAAAGAELRPGAPYVLDVLRFDTRLRDADAVVVGEGRLDAQSVMGKIVGEIAGRASRAGVPLHAIVGRSEIDREVAARTDLRSVTEATNLAELESAGEELARRLQDQISFERRGDRRGARLGDGEGT